MILRDAIFSSESRHLGAQPAPAPLPSSESLRRWTRWRSRAGRYEMRPAEAPPLSSDRVASWLVTQDGATRTALAAMLSDELAACATRHTKKVTRRATAKR